MTELVDSHAHLNSTAFEADREAVALQALADLATVIDVATGEDTTRVTLDLTSRHERIFSTVGVHPHEARRHDDAAVDRVLALGGGPKVVALGEMGLDYHYDFSPRPDQLRVFARQVDRARRDGRAVVVHVREAFEDAVAVLTEGPPPRGVVHCFTGDWDQARRFLDLGFYLGFTGMITFPRGRELLDVACRVPADRLLVETDAPYLTPHPYRNQKRNTPSMVRVTAGALARARGVDETELAARTTGNARALFSLPPPARPGDGVTRERGGS